MVEFIRPMEVLLNTIWLLVAIGAFLFWRPEKYTRTPTARDHKKSFGILALACALVLLFPVISLTDDLHAEQVTMEDSSRAIMKARALAQGCLRAGRTALIAAVTIPPYSADAPHFFFASVLRVEKCFFCLALIFPHEGRAPPFNA
ncbi:MAG: hypothetical protein ABSG32_09480 [Terriglobia bacterium]|jgi:hypothetical protein